MLCNESIVILALGFAVATPLSAVSIASTDETPIATQPLEKSYMVADSHKEKGTYSEKKDEYEKSDTYNRERNIYRDQEEEYSHRSTDKYGPPSAGEKAFPPSMMPWQAPPEEDTPAKQ